MTAEPIITMVGERVALGPLRRELLETYLRWNNDPAIMRTAPVPTPVTREAQLARFERTAAGTDPLVFTIYARAESSVDDGTDGAWVPIGTAALLGIDWRNGTAEYALLIGEATARGRGYGTEVTRLMIDYAFTALGLRSLLLRVAAYNLAGIAAYRNAGFREFGRRREEVWMGGQYWDTVYMDCLARDFTSPYLAPIFAPDTPR